MDAFARRQRRFMVGAALAWVVLAIAQALGVAWLWAYGFGGLVGWAPYPAFPWRDTISGVGCDACRNCFGCWPYEGLRSSLVLWAVVVFLPLIALPPRQRGSSHEAASLARTSPYREGLPAMGAAPDDAARLRARRARRALIAAASGACLLIHAHWQAVIIGSAPYYATVNGVAMLDLLVVVLVALAYIASASWPRSTPSPRP